MQFLNSLIGDSRVMYFGLLGLAAIIALLLVWIVYRVVFGRRRITGAASGPNAAER